jgi:hypothetical protein
VARWGGLRPKGPGGLWRVSGASRRSRTYTRDHSRKPPRHYAEAFTRATTARDSPILIQKNSVALRGISSATRFRTRWRRTGSANAVLQQNTSLFDHLVGADRISLEPTITAARWEAQAQLDPEGRSAPGQ